MKGCYVGFDTSNYTTSVAVCDEEGRILANLKAPLPVKAGERGLRQSDALFAHTKHLPGLCDRLGALLRERELIPLAVGVSARPRDVKDSYMPCFLAGVSAAHSFAAARNLPLYEFSHQNGHVMAALYSAGQISRLMKQPFLAFHVSGGTTEMLLVQPKGADFSVTLVGETEDINAGQVIDRVGVSLGLSFPCGRELESLAASYEGTPYRHPVCVRNGRCSLSGVENIALRLRNETGDASAVAAFVFDFIGRTLIRMGEQTMETYGTMPVLFAGGVMSNRLMRGELLRHFDAYFAEPEFSADNAAGIVLLCRGRYAFEK
ncbi:MAG: peptidase M22 [Clostridia bacterium]|nr:peptidase M22 [Clostridia bacterium]